ncbi:Acetyltransferase GNAT family [uncultured Eubacteriales bacterium]|uniref:Acetyltransferase GNAT family n=1 Tax=uncultured Eubacteriales bacterium TaxID=172733 RepID=A0A212JQF0_9FIRM|nr:Acetyltransferase GNAT family [uncultured Eubacteriales bacterium]
MTFRDYESSGCALMAKLFYDTVHTVNAKDYTNEQLKAWATGNVDLEAWNRSFLAYNTLIAEIDGTIVGFADMDDTGYLDRLFVHKDFQRRGVAYVLVTELEQRARNSGLSRFETYASITAKPFFERQGYTVEKENKAIRNGIVLLNYKMVKRI